MIGLQQKTDVATHIRLSTDEIIRDYTIAVQSRQASLVGRREVLSGKAKFGIFGDGKEVPQLAMAKAFRKGDFRSGYYRDQTLMLALGLVTIQEFFAQLYAHPDITADPHSAGRQMNAHFASHSLNPDGSWRRLTDQYNTASDISPTAGQMPRLVGLGLASRIYRQLESLHHLTQFSRHGNEVAFGTIGNASCAEGLFWEAVNAIGLLHVPVVISIYDDGYGISVTNQHQITKQNLSELLQGFQRTSGSQDGYDIYTVKAWDYPALVEIYARAAETARREHVPSIIHVVEVTQPQGHSTSGSHERYKSKERLEWETEFDCIHKMREWMIARQIATEEQLDEIEQETAETVENTRREAWQAYMAPMEQERREVVQMIQALEAESGSQNGLGKIRQSLTTKQNPLRKDILPAVHAALTATRHQSSSVRQRLVAWQQKQAELNAERYSSHLYSETAESALHIPAQPPVYLSDSPTLAGFEVLNAGFDAILARNARVVMFGEDVGKLGGVNQTAAGLQAKYGEERVFDTGIREMTIMGQAIGLAMRGLRPICEIQYLDYLLYCLQLMSDDLATLHWRTNGRQKAPVIVSTRGHRLEGIWHSGSPMAGIIHLVRGMHVCVPRDMTRAVGFYNTLLQGDDPAIVVEVLNGYRQKEKLPVNLSDVTVPLGVPEVLRSGDDITIVTYGACCRVALETADLLQKVNISAEVIDVQTLLPFDKNGRILDSLKKTNRILFLDEDVPGGATAYMLQEVIEKQGGYHWLDSEPRTLAAKPHRPAYGSDGNYFSKPNVEEVFDTVYAIMHESSPAHYPQLYK